MTSLPKLVIWDWNGTLLNDVDICVDNFNEIVYRHGVTAISKQCFRSLYRHPVKDMYDEVGVIFNASYSFKDLSDEWYAGYMEKSKSVQLFPDAIAVLSFFKDAGITQLLCSALEHDALTFQAEYFKVDNYFAELSGHHDLEAESKIARGVERFGSFRIAPKDTIMIGDSDHDRELATAIGCRCMMIDTGHQKLVTPTSTHHHPDYENAFIFQNLSAMLDYLRK